MNANQLYKLNFSLVQRPNSDRVLIFCESRPGSSCHRERVVGSLQRNTEEFEEFTKLARAYRVSRPYTVAETARVLGEILAGVRESAAAKEQAQ